MKAIAVNPRRSALKSARVHFVNPQRGAFCGLKPRNGWREVNNRTADCPKCCRRMASELAKLQNVWPMSALAIYTVCAWCPAYGRPAAVLVDADDKRPEATSHGICSQCEANIFGEPAPEAQS